MPLSAEEITARLVAILRDIQQQGGYSDFDRVRGDTKPLDDLEGFDSKLWVLAIRILARELGIPLPKNRSMFQTKDKQSLSVTQVAERVVQVLTKL